MILPVRHCPHGCSEPRELSPSLRSASRDATSAKFGLGLIGFIGFVGLIGLGGIIGFIWLRV